MVGRGRHRRQHLDVRQQIRTRNGVIHQRSGQQLSSVVVDRLFPERLTDALDDASVNLSLDDHRIDLRSAVVNGYVTLEHHATGVWLHLDHRHVRAEGIHEVRRIVEARGFEAGFHPGRHVPRDVGHQRDVLNGFRLRGRPLHEEAAVGVVHVLDRRFEQVSGECFRLVLDLPNGQDQGRPADGGRPAAVGAPPHRRLVGVTVHHLDVVDVDAELI